MARQSRGFARASAANRTRASLYPDLQARIKELHPYDVPEVIAVDIARGLPHYLDWISESTSGSDTCARKRRGVSRPRS
jgi:CutA1 divalent ion tolerance protein